MKKIKNEFGETAYEFTTSSGLKTSIIHRPGFKRTAAAYATPFGALNLKQKVNGELIEHKSGLAHFLEHKLFEDENRDVLSQFSQLGASGNAFTSYDETVYYFGVNDDPEASLRLLLQFVSSFDISEESVEKEKGIIVEELKMYEQMPHMRLLNETYRAIFHSFPYIYDIAGTEESVNATTLEDLKQAYHLNYSDTNMTLTIVSPVDPHRIHDIVIDATQNHAYQTQDVENVFDEEPFEVKESYKLIKDQVEVPKMSYGLKLKNPFNSNVKFDFVLGMLFEMNFSEFNDDYQELLDTGVLSNGFYFGTEVKDQFGICLFINEGTQIEAFQEYIQNRLRNLEVSETHFNQLSKRYYGDMIMSLSKTDELAISFVRMGFEGMNWFEFLEMVRGVTLEDLIQVRDIIDADNMSLVVMQPELDKEHE